MNPQSAFCPNLACPARGRRGMGNIGVHSRKDRRYICHECKKSFRESQGTLFYRLRNEAETVVLVVTLLSYGCPVQAIVKAFGFDERTVRSWWQRAGAQAEAAHGHLVAAQAVELVHVQLDEIKVKTQGASIWMAMVLMVSTRLWLGGALSEHRDLPLIR